MTTHDIAQNSPLSASHPLETWFEQRGWTPFPFQREAWDAYLRGESGLIHTATGTGKTYAAWLGPLAEWITDGGRWTVDGTDNLSSTVHRPLSKHVPPLRVIWLTPLRALAADTAVALRAPLDELGIPWTLETRTGDMSASTRARQRQRLPTALITTPESLSLLLARADAATLFGDLRAVIVDEWHELLASKRGTQTELALARLRRFAPTMCTWGLSATLGNLDVALAALVGGQKPEARSPQPGAAEAQSTEHTQNQGLPNARFEILNPEPRTPNPRLIRGLVPKTLIVDALLPASVERFPWAGHLGLKMLPQVVAAIEEGRSALVFTNTRAQTELWYQAILDARPDWAGEIALHHGSLGRDVRDWVEQALKDGGLRCVVSTSSLDLGVDFAPVDRVLQIGSPKGVARLLQRAGRSGHQPGRPSRVTVVPTNAFELIEVAAVRSAIQMGMIEARLPVARPLDVLVQHIVTCALGGGFVAAELLAEVRTTYAYRDLTDAEWRWTLDFATQGGPALQNYPEYQRIALHDGRYTVDDTRIARRQRMSIGTIVSEAALQVQFLKGGKLGSIEEAFVARLKRGDRFVFAGRTLEFVRVRDMTVWVRLAASTKGTVPRWSGGRMPLSGELAAAVRAKLNEARDGVFDDPEMAAVRPILAVQNRWSIIPASDELLIERLKTREGHHLFCYPFEGRAVHEGMAALFAYRLSRLQPISFTIAVNDYGFELLSPEPAPFEAQSAERGAQSADRITTPTALFTLDNLTADISASLNATEMQRRQFREIARVAGLVYQGFPGEKSIKQLQASSGLIYDVFTQYDPQNMLLAQAAREVLERQLEQSRLRRALERLAGATLVVREIARPTPFAFPLLVDRLRETLTSEKLADRVQKMQLQLEKAAG